MDYEKLLDEAYAKMPKKSDSGERFRMPKASIQPAGAKTIITNINEITGTLRRKPDHFVKFLLTELATSGDFDGSKLVVQGRFRADVVDKKIELYAKEYVLCPDCGKPDTKIIREDRYSFLKCEACGSKNIVKKVYN
jgi:translation initiation factor 2 subunit 2